MIRILSTKKLAKNQEELLLNAGLNVVQYDAIKTESLDFELSDKKVENAVFTSKNAVKAILKKSLKIEKSFCVGEKTSELLKENGLAIKECAQNAADLAQLIIDKYSEETFIFFCGNKRRDELPEMLSQKNINLKEIQVYKTSLNPIKISGTFDGVLFFSPSGIKSFTENNETKSTAFCIGETTASEARKHFENVIVATKPGIENVIAKAVNYYRKETHRQ